MPTMVNLPSTDFNVGERSDYRFGTLVEPSFISLLGQSIREIVDPVTKIRGADFSHWNGDIDFEEVRNSDIDFVIIKATESDYFLDPKFHENWKAALANDLIVAPYHFFRDNVKGAPQVEWFFRKENGGEFIEAVEGKTVLFWDVEQFNIDSITARRNRLHGGLIGTENKGVQAGIYSTKYHWETYLGDVAWANDYVLWPAHWTSASMPLIPNGWNRSNVKFWQYGIYPTHSWVDVIHGDGSIDANWFYGSVEDLRELFGLGQIVVPPPPVDCCEELAQRIAFLEGAAQGMKVRQDEFSTALISATETMNVLRSDLDQLNEAGFDLAKKVETIETRNSRIDDAHCEE